MEQIIETPAANADAANVTAPEGVAAPTTTEGTPDVVTPDAPTTDTPAEPAPKPDVSETKAFSERLNKMVAEKEKAVWEKVNPVIEKLGGTLPDGSPIKTFEDLQKALEHQELQAEAEKQNVPVEVLSRLTQAERDALEAKNMLSQYQRKEALAKESETLSADTKWGEFFKANEAEIRKVADQVNCDLSTAKLIVYDRVGPTKVDEEAIANKAIQDFIDKKRALNKPTEGSGATPVQVVQTPKTYAEAREGAKAYLRALREQT